MCTCCVVVYVQSKLLEYIRLKLELCSCEIIFYRYLVLHFITCNGGIDPNCIVLQLFHELHITQKLLNTLDLSEDQRMIEV